MSRETPKMKADLVNQSPMSLGSLQFAVLIGWNLGATSARSFLGC
jgi:hypothetical protein